MKKIVYLLLIYMPTVPLHAQEYMSSYHNFNELFNDIVQTNVGDYEEIYDALYQYYLHPLNINTASTEQLLSLYVLNTTQVNDIRNHIEHYGEFISIYELQQIPSLNTQTIKYVAALANVLPRFSNNKLYVNPKHEILCRTSIQNSTINNIMTRLQFGFSHGKLGLTLQQDAGEAFGWNPSKNIFLTDYTSIYYLIKPKYKHISTVIIGDYKMQFGQGLVFSAGLNIHKSSETITSVQKHNLGSKPYQSTIANGYFKGVTSTIHLRQNLTLTPFFSYKQIDASLNSAAQITSINVSGLHQTNRTIQNKANATQIDYGINISTIIGKGRVGLNSIQTIFNKNILASNEHYLQNRFNGRLNHTMSLEFAYDWQNINLFSEMAIASSKGKAFIVGLTSALSSRFDIALLFRNYMKNFHSFYGNGFKESSENSNETGLYGGIKFKISPQILFTAYVDRYKFNAPTYHCDGPSNGFDYLFKISYLPSKSIQLFGQLKFDQKEKNGYTSKQATYVILPYQKKQIGLGLITSAEKQWQFNIGALFSAYTFLNTNYFGQLVYQKIQYKNPKIDIGISGTQFNIDDYEARIYLHENDLPATFYMPGFNGKGNRSTLLMNLKMTKLLKITLKLSRTYLYNEPLKKYMQEHELKLGLLSTF